MPIPANVLARRFTVNPPHPADLTGLRFGRLIVVSRATANRKYFTRWNCQCDCGKQSVAHRQSLISGKSKSCGCLRFETKPNLSHGQTRTPTYKIWNGMRNRCRVPSVRCWANYGGRGIRVCERWDSFENFLADMGPRPSQKHSIERKDVNGDYEPANCYWATVKEQARNTRANHVVEYLGRSATLAEWAEITGVKANRIYRRLQNRWSVKDALMTPVEQKYAHPPRHSNVVIEGVAR